MMKDSITHKHIAILDFGSQYTHLISRRLRDARVFSKIYPHDTPAKTLASERPIGVILSGGPKSVYEADAPSYDAKLFELGIPILGICYGQQLIARQFEGEVKHGKVREYGFAKFKIKIEKSKF
ncbi:MAG TPA: GMP synthase (glutamine-hydrolyzing), partial [Candidatus Jacksonbacteria bacterium]|nr:GMP synthase (glutamine-hydrolyzing) [Candidatus Jacksonbacteria bacterium]